MIIGNAVVITVSGTGISAISFAAKSRGFASGRPFSEWSCVAVIKALRQILDRAVITDVLIINPMSRVQRHTLPKQRNRTQPRVLDADDLDTLVAAAVERTPSYAGIIAVAAFTGARIREVLGLRWQDIDPAARADLLPATDRRRRDRTGAPEDRRCRTGRTRSSRSLEPFLGREARMKARWVADDDFGLLRVPGKPREYRNVRRAIAVAAPAEAKPRARPAAHDLRHSATSVLLRHADLAPVSRYVGHQSPATTLRVYSHALGSQEEQAARIAEAAKSAGFGQ